MMRCSMVASNICGWFFPDGESGRRRGQTLSKRGQIGDSADGLDLFEAGQFVGEGNNVDGVLCVHQLAHAHEDAAVGVEGEIILGQFLGGFSVGSIVKQDGAKDGFFSVYVRGETRFVRDVRGGGHINKSVGRRGLCKTETRGGNCGETCVSGLDSWLYEIESGADLID